MSLYPVLKRRMRGAPWLRLAPTDLIRLIHRVRRRPWHVPCVACPCLNSTLKRCSLQANASSASPSQSVPRVKVTFCLQRFDSLERQHGRVDVMIHYAKLISYFTVFIHHLTRHPKHPGLNVGQCFALCQCTPGTLSSKLG